VVDILHEQMARKLGEPRALEVLSFFLSLRDRHVSRRTGRIEVKRKRVRVCQLFVLEELGFDAVSGPMVAQLSHTAEMIPFLEELEEELAWLRPPWAGRSASKPVGIVAHGAIRHRVRERME
jgi:hypothetical protein